MSTQKKVMYKLCSRECCPTVLFEDSFVSIQDDLNGLVLLEYNQFDKMYELYKDMKESTLHPNQETFLETVFGKC